MEREQQNALIERLQAEHGEEIVKRLICKGVPLHDAEDATQIALAKAFVCFRSGKGPRKSERQWLFTIAWRAFLDYRERQDREYERWRLLAEPGLVRMVADPFDEATRSEEQEAVAAAMESLTFGQKEVVKWRFVEGWSLAEIAECLDISRGAVAGRLKRALNQLHKALSKYESDAVRRALPVR